MEETSLLIDYNSIISKYDKYLNFFKNKIVFPKIVNNDRRSALTFNYSFGICLIIPKIILETLDLEKNGISKIKYINSHFFLNKVSSMFYIIYDEKKKVGEIYGNIFNSRNINLLISSLNNNFPSDTIFMSRIDKKNITIFIEAGFHSSFICNKSPFIKTYKKNGLCVYRNNIEPFQQNTKSYLELKNTVFNYKNKICKIRIKFNKETIDFLKNLCYTGMYIKNNKFVQNEMAGSLILNINDQGYYDIVVKKEHIITGKEEEVYVVKSRYNFHTHPENAYIKNKVSDGHPSGQDYLGYLQAIKQYGTVFHCVVAIEGMYIISLKEYWCFQDRIYSIPENTIEDIFNIEHDSMSHILYMKTVNKLSYKKNPLFNVYFLEWDKYDTIFSIYSSKEENNCLISDENYNLHKKLYNKK